MLHGVPTEGFIVVSCNIYGELIKAELSNGYYLYDYAWSKISEEQITEAKKVALELLDGKECIRMKLSIFDGRLLLMAYYEEYRSVIVEIT